MNWRRWRKRASVHLMRVVTVMLVAALVGGFLLFFYQDFASAGGNESITYTLQPSIADTYGDEKSPGTNYGSVAVMDVGTKTGNILHSLVQFDISSIPIPPDATVNSANLSLYLSTAPSESRTHNAHRVTSLWVEGTVTWTDEPTFDGTATASTVTDVYDGVWLIWDVTADISAYLGGTTNYGWLIKDSIEGTNKAFEGSYTTKEEVDTLLHPTLSITFTAPWESYQTSSRTLVWGDVGTPYNIDNYIVYMKGTGFATGNYTVGYYDGDGDRQVDEDIFVSGDGILNGAYDLTTDKGAVGDAWWHALVQPFSGYTSWPNSYAVAIADPDVYGLMANDSFYVAETAIPEFPTVMAGITVAGLCFGIYYWMRKRRLAYVKA